MTTHPTITDAVRLNICADCGAPSFPFATGPLRRYVSRRLWHWRLALSDIIREVDEELRRENWEILWKKYGKLAVAAAVALVLGTAGVVGWREFDRSQREGFAADREVRGG